MGNSWLGGESPEKGGGSRQTRWLTPKPLVDSLGPFDLDPCGAPGHPLAKITYLLEDGNDGLRDMWFGRVWLNPPYGKEAEPFLTRLADHGVGTALIFARTETRVFHEQVWNRASGVLFLRGRIRFLDSKKVVASANAGAPSCLVAYGKLDAAMLRLTPVAGHYVPLGATE